MASEKRVSKREKKRWSWCHTTSTSICNLWYHGWDTWTVYLFFVKYTCSIFFSYLVEYPVYHIFFWSRDEMRTEIGRQCWWKWEPLSSFFSLKEYKNMAFLFPDPKRDLSILSLLSHQNHGLVAGQNSLFCGTSQQKKIQGGLIHKNIPAHFFLIINIKVWSKNEKKIFSNHASINAEFDSFLYCFHNQMGPAGIYFWKLGHKKYFIKTSWNIITF